MTKKQTLVRGIAGEWLEQLPVSDGEPDMYPPEIVRAVFQVGLRHLRGVHRGRSVQAAIEAAEQFRRRVEINHIFRFLPPRLRRHPTGATTIDKVLEMLQAIGIKCEVATVKRDYKVLGGARALRSILPASGSEEHKSLLDDGERR